MDHTVNVQLLERFKFLVTINVNTRQYFLALINLYVVPQLVICFWVFFTDFAFLIGCYESTFMPGKMSLQAVQRRELLTSSIRRAMLAEDNELASLRMDNINVLL